MGLLTEKLKKTFLKQPQDFVETPDKPLKNIKQSLDNSDFDFNYQAFFDNGSTLSRYYNAQAFVTNQNAKLAQYRKIAKNPTVKAALNKIVDEVIYSQDDQNIFTVAVDIENSKIQKAIEKSFDKIVRLLNPSKNLFKIVLDSYIDGQMNFFIKYNNKGIEKIFFIDPSNLFFDITTETYRFLDTTYSSLYSKNGNFFINPALVTQWKQAFKRVDYKADYDTPAEYNIEEIVHADFGLRDNENLILSYLEDSIKSANVLQTLEDLLIPLRYSRSVSRRIFNVDVSDLNPKRAEGYMQKIMNKFSYNKLFNTETGEVSDQQHITGMVEDYWFGNMTGEKGVSVDVLDETGNLGELSDIKYIRGNLLNSLGVPLSFVENDENQALMSSAGARDEITREEYDFYLRVKRLRGVYTDAIKQILKRDLISSKIISEDNWNKIHDSVQVKFTSENEFFKRLRMETFLKQVDAFSTAQDFAGNILPVKMLYKTIFNYSDSEIEKILEDLSKERKSRKFKNFYPDDGEESDDFGGGDAFGGGGFGDDDFGNDTGGGDDAFADDTEAPEFNEPGE